MVVAVIKSGGGSGNDGGGDFGCVCGGDVASAGMLAVVGVVMVGLPCVYLQVRFAPVC